MGVGELTFLRTLVSGCHSPLAAITRYHKQAYRHQKFIFQELQAGKYKIKAPMFQWLMRTYFLVYRWLLTASSRGGRGKAGLWDFAYNSLAFITQSLPKRPAS